MRFSKTGTLVAMAAASALLLTACSGTANGGAATGDTVVPKTDGKGKTITVWTMQDDYDAATIAAINAEFEKQTGAKVNIQEQQWNGITTKISTALATSTPPDVLDLGNTQVASFAENGGLLDLTPYKKDLQQGQTWVTGLEEPATVDGALYAVPSFAGSRAVLYNKKIWAAAGVTEAPTTYAELTAALDKVKAANTEADFSPLYFPGQNWQASLQWVWDAGGDIATVKNGTWSGALSSPEAQKGLEAWKDFQNTYSTPASQTLDVQSPAQVQVFADGKTSAIIATYGLISQVLKANPALTADDLGAFALPGISGKPQPVLIGGSDWGIPTKTTNKDLALQWTKIAASPTIQKDFVFGSNGWIPNSTELATEIGATLDPTRKAFFDATQISRATPAAARWADLEGDKSINNLFTSIASGAKSAKDAAATFDQATDKTLNKK
ncbi:extracellular solute-binding protein [Mycetocola lacteus]|uniref:Extracellular solute-binding protein n=1 Tax=Mycetocola lacteus TaxID=76637 RepID=A0A3L7AW69_9MICO|nr:extracellular solute-binding protein [Mycetocola lacteus]RLP83780.1 extracellular solute-binding protein [Mycetocola lacteus]